MKQLLIILTGLILYWIAFDNNITLTLLTGTILAWSSIYMAVNAAKELKEGGK